MVSSLSIDECFFLREFTMLVMAKFPKT